MAAGDDAPRGLAHRREDRRRRLDRPDQLRLERADDGSVGPADLPDDLRLVELPAVGDGGVGVGDLEDGCQVKALADARLENLARVDRQAVVVHLPLVGRDQAGRLEGEIDAGRAPEPQLLRPVGQALHAEAVGELVEVGVTGVAEALVDVQGAPAPLVPLPELGAPQLDVGLAGDRGRGRDDLVSEAADACHDLVRGARRLDIADGMVDERLVRVVEQDLELGVRDPAGELVGVVGGEAHHGEHLAGLRVEHDHGAALEARLGEAPLEGLLGELLLLRVDRQDQGAAGGGRRLDADHADRAPGPVLLHPLGAIGPPQLSFVGQLHAGLADPIVGEVALLRQLRVAFGGEGPGVAHDLGQQGSTEVVAARLDRHLHPRKGEAVLGDQASGRLGDVVGDRHGVEARGGANVQAGVDGPRGRAEQSREPLHHLWSPGEREVGRAHPHGECRYVRDEGPAGSIVDEPPGRDDGLQGSSARLTGRARRRGPRGGPRRARHRGEAERQPAHDDHHGDAEGHEAGGPPLMGQGLLENAHQSTRSPSSRCVRRAKARAIGAASAATTAARIVEGTRPAVGSTPLGTSRSAW